MAAAQTIQMLGMIGAVSYVAARLIGRSGGGAFHRYAILAQPRRALPAMPRGFSVRELGAEELSRHTVDAPAAAQARRFAEGLTCLGAFDSKARLTGLIWLREGRHDEDEVAVAFLLPQQCCWDTGLWIAPEYRMGRSFAALWAGAGAWMDARGITHSLSRVSDYNIAALRAHKSMGASVLAHYSFLRLGRWQWSLATRPRLVRLGGGGAGRLDLGRLLPAAL